MDSDGFCDYPDTSATGITLSLLDQHGNQLPSTYYDVSVTAHSPTGLESAAATTRVGVELPWTGNSFWAVAYLDAYLKDSTSDRALDTMFADMITQIWNSRYGGYSVINCPYREQPIPARLQYVADWGSLANSLYDQRVRNFIYFGHANKTGIGHNDINLSLTVTNLQQLLKNGADPLTGWNKHPYHFVFLDGCDSGKGDLCKVFGIPKQKMSVAQMQARGLFPRAFLGWKGKTAKSVKNVLPGDHQRYVMTLFELWPQTNPVTGLPYKLWEAIDAAARQPPDPRGALWTSIQQDLIIWGCQDLEFWP